MYYFFSVHRSSLLLGNWSNLTLLTSTSQSQSPSIYGQIQPDRTRNKVLRQAWNTSIFFKLKNLPNVFLKRYRQMSPRNMSFLEELLEWSLSGAKHTGESTLTAFSWAAGKDPSLTVCRILGMGCILSFQASRIRERQSLG